MADTAGQAPPWLDDSTVYEVNFEPDANDQLDPNVDSMEMRTADDETFSCSLPSLLSHGGQRDSDWTTDSDAVQPNVTNPLRYLASRLNGVCSHHISQYWVYSLCHFHSVNQSSYAAFIDANINHRIVDQAAEGNSMTVYRLGQYELDNLQSDSLEEARKIKTGQVFSARIEGKTKPYVGVSLSNGTMCDLTGRPRSTQVRYVCDPDADEAMLDAVEELSTCRYVMTVKVQDLCRFATYRFVEPSRVNIQCVRVPKLDENETSTDARPWLPAGLKARQERIDHLTSPANSYSADIPDATADSDGELHALVSSLRKIFDKDSLVEESDTSSTAKFSDLPLQSIEKEVTTPKTSVELETKPEKVPTMPTKPTLLSPVARKFINGKHCLTTKEADWWQYEFCFGRHVKQVHKYHSQVDSTEFDDFIEQDDDVVRMTKLPDWVITLGRFNETAHIQWIDEAPDKRQPNEKRIRYLYTNGDVCSDAEGKSRSVQVKLYCKEDAASSYVSLFLTEPRICDYRLVVESPVICDVLPLIDKYGLIRPH